MTRLLMWLAALALFVGCQGSGAGRLLDPFSRTRVEPPRTGCILGQPADPYYAGTRQAALTPSNPSNSGLAAVSSSTRSSANSSNWANTTPSGGRDDLDPPTPSARESLARGPGDRVAIPVAARNATTSLSRWADRAGAPEVAARQTDIHSAHSTPVAATSSAVAATGASAPSAHETGTSATDRLAGPERVVQTIQPRPRDPLAPASAASAARPVSAGSEARRLAAPQGPIDIMDLPPAGSTSSARSLPTSGAGAVRLASATEAVRSTPGKASPISPATYTSVGGDADSFSSGARYGYDPEYRWLRGRLEYSQIDRRWKLRYIPIDGKTDQFGGSVVLADESRLTGYERGQFVEVRGRLGRGPEDDGGYAPEFQIDQIKRLGN